MTHTADIYRGLATEKRNDNFWLHNSINEMKFIDIAVVTSYKDNRISCKAGAVVYTNVELLILGVSGYGVKVIPTPGDRVILFSAATTVYSVEKYKVEQGMLPYDRAGLKAIPLTDSNTKQLFTVTIDGINLTGPVKATLNDDGIYVEDANGNIVVTDSNGVHTTDCNNNDIVTDSAGIHITDCNNNTIEMTADGTTTTDCNGNSVTTSSSGVEIKGQSGTLVVK